MQRQRGTLRLPLQKDASTILLLLDKLSRGGSTRDALKPVGSVIKVRKAVNSGPMP